MNFCTICAKEKPSPWSVEVQPIERFQHVSTIREYICDECRDKIGGFIGVMKMSKGGAKVEIKVIV